MILGKAEKRVGEGSNERNLHDFACFNAPWHTQAGFQLSVYVFCLLFWLQAWGGGVLARGLNATTPPRVERPTEEIIFLGFSSTKVPRARGISIRSCFTYNHQQPFLHFRCFVYVYLFSFRQLFLNLFFNLPCKIFFFVTL